MQGIELSRRFYSEVVRPWLDAAAPGLPHAAALIGYGSELLRFDDDTSRDHNWGPRVQLFVSRETFDAHAQRLVDGIADDVEPRIGPYHDRPFATINADDMIAATLDGIEGPHLRALPVTGALDQVTDLTPVLEDPVASQRMMRALVGGG